MALILYDNPASSNALKVRFMLAELCLAYERRTVPFDQPRPDWYLAVNPVGGIPALDDDGFTIAESHAILRYLAARENRGDLCGSTRHERGLVDEFLDRWALTFRPAFFRFEAPALGFVPGKGMRAAPPDTGALPVVAEVIAPQLRLLDGLVDSSGYAIDRFTLVDVAAAPVLYRTIHTGLDLTPYPNVERWRDTLIHRPSFAAAEPVV
jgi:glutathione S-transferase